MAQLQNKEILNAIRSEQSSEYQEKIPMANGMNDVEIMALLDEYPTHKNNFINTLTNKIGKELFFSKVFNNPYKMLHKGMLPYGKSIQEMFVEMAEKKGFDDHFTGSTTAEGDLIKAVKPNVKVDYATQNYAYKFKTSISDAQIRGAFTNQNGLSTLLDQIVNSLYSSSNFAEFEDMKKILTNYTKDSSNGSTIGTGLVQQLYADATTKANCFVTMGASINGKELCKQIRAKSGRLTFPSRKYNLAGVNNWTNKEDLVLFVTPEIEAEIDVEVLASAFNVSSADVNVRTLLIDELGSTKASGGNEVVAILADKDVIQAYDTVNQTRTFDNGDQLVINYFAHKQGIMTGCKFANAIVFVKGDTLL